MRRNMITFCTLVAVALFSSPFSAAENAAAAIPKGDLSTHTFDQSKIFPGTSRSYTLYVPKQYDPAKPACVHVNQDGVGFNAPAVFDRLIYEKAMPVTVGVFVTPGNAAGRNNRSYEYDAMTDDYVRFLVDELLPYIAKKHELNLSTKGNDRSIAGTSSGGICSFTAASGASRRLPPRLQQRRQFRRASRRLCLCQPRSQGRAEADSRLSAGRLQRPEIRLRRLVAGQSRDGRGVDIFRLRGRAFLGQGRS